MENIVKFFTTFGVILGGNPIAKLMTITPELAEKFLSLNFKNRPVSRQLVRHYVKLMENGKWVLNGESVKFDVKGRNIDAQHRLLACIKSNVPFETFVIFNLPVEAFKTLDTGKMRSGADVLSIEGYKYAKTTASAIRLISILTDGAMSSYRLTNEEILDFADNNPEIIECSEFGHKYYDIGDHLVSASWLSATLFILSKIDREEAHQFVYDLATGADLSPEDWVFRIRTRLAIMHRSNTQSVTKKGMANHIFYAWNLRRTNSDQKNLRVPQVDFPDINKLQ